LTSVTPNPAVALESEAFQAALAERRDLVYEYLETWPGAAEFKPADIHEGLFAYVRHRGKGLRPFLLLLSCGAMGGDEWQALPAAAAVEIFHIWTLVHDDIIDRDETRRGHATVHAAYASQAREELGLSHDAAAHYGQAVAILAGDLQQSWSYALLTDLLERGVGPPLVLELIRRMSTSLTPQLLEGELLDVQFSLADHHNLGEAEVMHMLGMKTAVLLEYAAWAGAKIGLQGRPDVEGFAERLARFAFLCGTAFQMQDDILGLTADERVLGKPVGADIREGKHTLVLYRTLAKVSGSERETLLQCVGNAHATADEVSQALSIISASGAIEEVAQLADGAISHALDLLNALPESPQKSLLASWATFMLRRNY
jgi:geranylgeranyl diphosphate synthase, type I